MRLLASSPVLLCTFSLLFPTTAPAQGLSIKGYAMVGGLNFAAAESFDAVLGSSSGTIYGGGGEVGLPLGGLFVGVGGWRFEGTGERVFVSGDVVYPLGIPVTIEMTPLEITGGWRFRGLWSRLVPYAGAGWSSYSYKETSSFAEAAENVDERFSGFHLAGGAEVRITRWLGAAGEVVWTSVPDAIGAAGVSEVFDETDLGGTTFRLKITVGR
jgi:hypothetical protein